MAAAARYAGRSLVRRPAPMVGRLFDRSPAASVALALPSSSLCRCFSSNNDSTSIKLMGKKTTKKGLAIALMKNRPLDVKDRAATQISCLDALLDILKVHHRDDTTMLDAAAADRRAVEEKKQELALLLHKAEVEGGDKHTAQIREKTAEFAAAAHRLRDLLLPQVLREDIERLKDNVDWLMKKHY